MASGPQSTADQTGDLKLAKFNLFKQFVEKKGTTLRSIQLSVVIVFSSRRLRQTVAFVVLMLIAAVTIVSVYTTRTTRTVQEIAYPTLQQYNQLLKIDPNPSCACSNTAFALSTFTSTNYTLDYICQVMQRLQTLCVAAPSLCANQQAGLNGGSHLYGYVNGPPQRSSVLLCFVCRIQSDVLHRCEDS